MATLAQLEEQIFQREGFRVKFTPLGSVTKGLPAYEFPIMGSNKWRISDWKNTRLSAYVSTMKGVTVLRGDGEPVKTDMRLGNLRDSYFEAQYGASEPAPAEHNVVQLRPKPSGPRA
jgi:hypothetical protein